MSGAEPPSPEPPGSAPQPQRWAHALFPVAWSTFLLMATALTVFRAGSPAGLPVAAARTPARDLFAVIALGVALLWPMIRLSERAPAHRVARAARAMGDTIVVVAPALTVVLASQLVVGWGWATTAALGALLASWASLVGAFLAIGAGGRTGASRSLWMAFLAALTLGAPAVMALASPSDERAERRLMLASPVTAPSVLTASSSGAPGTPSAEMWLAAAAPGLASLAVWWVALATPRRVRAATMRATEASAPVAKNTGRPD